MVQLKLKKLRDNVKMPVRANPTDAGLDVFWNPSPGVENQLKAKRAKKRQSAPLESSLEGLKSGAFELEGPDIITAVIYPHENLVLGTGIAVEFPAGYAMEVKNRSSMGSKKDLVVGAHLIDSSYRGEIFIDLHNIGKQIQNLKAGDKIAQLVIYPIETPEYEVVEELSDTARGKNGFGSTGK